MARSLWILSALFLAGCTSASGDYPDEQAAGYRTPAVPRLVVVSPTGTGGEARAARDYAPLPKDAGAFMKCAACHTLIPGINGLGPSLAGGALHASAVCGACPTFYDTGNSNRIPAGPPAAGASRSECRRRRSTSAS